MITTGENLKCVSGVYCATHRETGMVYIGSSANMGKRRKPVRARLLLPIRSQWRACARIRMARQRQAHVCRFRFTGANLQKESHCVRRISRQRNDANRL